MSTSKYYTARRVSYFYDEEIGNYHYGSGHPMKPHRIRMAHNLILNYGLYKKMDVFRPQLVTERQMTEFHTDDYIEFQRRITPDNQYIYQNDQIRYSMDIDSPVFDGIYRFCQIYTGGTVGSAYRINNKLSDICINWSGGLHHAKKSEASGFCYVNDIVLGIQELLKYNERVLYIDIDVHHCDGVEEAFYTTNRVMTVSFHHYGDFFPGTGSISDIGVGKGKNYSINFPLREGMDDDSFVRIFKDVVDSVMEHFRPGSIVLQCGADSLTGDRLGVFNLTIRGHGACVEYMTKWNIPLIVLGGGGYTIRNVSRCWTYETGILLNTRLPNELPYNEYYEYYGPEYKLHIPSCNMENRNSRKELQETTILLRTLLKDLEFSPSVQYSNPIPPSIYDTIDTTAVSSTSSHPSDSTINLSIS